MIIVVVLAVILIAVPLLLWGFNRMRAGRGGGSSDHSRDGRGSNNVTGVVFTLITLGFGVALPVLILTGNHSHASAKVGNVSLNHSERTGRELFGQHCGVCHTLAAANAIGKVGPNLDLLKPGKTLILHTLANGCLPNPTGSAAASESCLGQGVMPADVVTGQDANDVASFVAAVAGNE